MFLQKCLQRFDEVVHHCPGDILNKGYTIPKNPTKTQHPLKSQQNPSKQTNLNQNKKPQQNSPKH